MKPERPEKLKNESANAYAYFLRYCEMGAHRNLDALADENCTDTALQKKVSRRTIAKWSKKCMWQARVETYDRSVARLAFEALLEKQKEELHNFIEKDLVISRAMQGIIAKHIQTLSSSDDTNVRELRGLVISYTHTREWIKDLIGLTELQEQIEKENNDE